jgi:hypothetical protein
MSNNLENWLRNEGLHPIRRSPKHIRLYFEHNFAQFALDITLHDAFVYFGADLISDVEGRNKSEFYEFVHRFNTELNGPKVTLQGSRFILVREHWYEDMVKDNLIRDIYWFKKVHEQALETLIKEANRLDLHFKHKK